MQEIKVTKNEAGQRLDKLLIVDPAVAGHPGTHIAIEVIAIFILIIDQHFELFFRLLTSATHFTQQASGILYLFFCQIFDNFTLIFKQLVIRYEFFISGNVTS